MKDIDLEKLREGANPNCKVCLGRGWIVDGEETESLGPCHFAIGDLDEADQLCTGEANDVKISREKKRVCPRCFDPENKPRG